MKNIEKSKILNLCDEITYLENQIVSKIITQNKHRSLTLFSIDKNQEISTHTTKGDALVQILDGTAQITIDDKNYILNAGESIIMPKNIPHSLYAKERFKMLLGVYFEE